MQAVKIEPMRGSLELREKRDCAPSRTQSERSTPGTRRKDPPRGMPHRMTRPHRPAFDEFLRWAGHAPCVPVFRQLTGDGLTPVSAFARIERSPPSFLFESVIGGEKVGRYSFLGTEPFLRRSE